MAMMVSAVMLSGVTSREFIPGVLARLVDGADERAISVGISAALFGLFGLRDMDRGTNLSLPPNPLLGFDTPRDAANPFQVQYGVKIRF